MNNDFTEMRQRGSRNNACFGNNTRKRLQVIFKVFPHRALLSRQEWKRGASVEHVCWFSCDLPQNEQAED